MAFNKLNGIFVVVCQASYERKNVGANSWVPDVPHVRTGAAWMWCGGACAVLAPFPLVGGTPVSLEFAQLRQQS